MKNYKFFTYKPNTDFIFQYSLNKEYWENISIFEGDYEHEDYGAFDDDVDYALSHASGVIHKLENDPDDQELKEQLLSDFENYLACMEYFSGNRKDAYEILIALVSFEMVERAYLKIIDYYITCRKNYMEGDGPSREGCLDFNSLYIAIGDRELIEKQNTRVALMYYSLAGLSWPVSEHIYINNYSHNKVDPLNGLSDEKVQEWNDKESTLNQIYKGLTNTNLESFDCSDKEVLQSKFEKCLVLAKSYDDSAVEEIDSFLNYLGENFDEVNDRTRLVLTMLGSLKKQCTPMMLYFLSNESEDAQDAFSEEIIESVDLLPWEQYASIKTWLSKTEKSDVHRKVLLFFKAKYSIDLIENLLRIKNPDSVSAYYTSFETFSLMLPNHCSDTRSDECGKFAVMNVAYMNDPNEGVIIRKRLFGENRIPHKDSERNVLEAPFVFLKCFTSLIDYLPMWQMYADSAQGVCIVINWDSSSDTSLYRVCYLHKSVNGYKVRKNDNPGLETVAIETTLSSLTKICNKLQGNDERLVFDSFLAPILYLFKDSSYSYEQELRIMYHYDQSYRSFRHTNQLPPKLYVLNKKPLAIKELVLGPKFKDVTNTLPYLTEQLKLMAEKTHTNIPKITISNIDFR